MKSKIIKEDFGALTKLVKEFGRGYAVDVGIMGAKDTEIDRDEGNLTNPQLGFIHEFGSGSVPMRSFLRMPLHVKANDILKDVMEAGALKKMAAGNIYGVMADLGIACETAIGEAFDTSGFGDWDHLKSGEASHLTNTGQLRRSIASQVVTT